MANALPRFLEVAGAWKMSFQSAHFLLFLPIVVGAYFVLPKRWRPGWLLLASGYFYLFAAPAYLPVLAAGILFSYLAGRAIGAAKTRRGKNAGLAMGILGLVLALSFFKYNDLFAAFLTPLLGKLGLAYHGGYFITAGAVGISFYTFTAIGYLIDTWRGDVSAEKNLGHYALFLGFFASVTQGPISRAGDLLPQLTSTTRSFDAAAAANGLRLMAIGFFKKLAVADMLGVYVDAVYGNIGGYSGLSLGLAAVLFVPQLYFDFSGYTDIARGAASLLGVRLPENFQNPYFATNFSSFWARWHMSLSNWLQDYIFTPLVWSRWTEKLPLIGKHLTKPPVLSSIAIVFLVSGIWHGDTLCFAVWGALMAAYRIGEELLHRTLGKPKKKLAGYKRAGKTAVVLVLWCASLVFFRTGMNPAESNGVRDALAFFAGSFNGISLSAMWQSVYNAFASTFFNKPFMVACTLGFTIAATMLAAWADWTQCYKLKGGSLAEGLGRIKTGRRWLVYYILVLGAFAGFVARSGASFLYGGF